MDFRRIITSTKSYKIALVVAIAFLLLLSSISYRQINSMEKSANLVSSSLIVDKEINNLFAKFSRIEASTYKSLIVYDSLFNDGYKLYQRETEASLLNLSQLTKDIPEQLKYLDTVSLWRDSLDITISNLIEYHGQLEDNVEAKLMIEVYKLTQILQKLNILKLVMTQKKEVLFRQHMIAYKTETFFTPFISLLLALFSLIVFWLAFRKINNDRKKIISTQAYIDNIVAHSNNLITYLKPIKNETGKIIDFTIEYTSNKIEDFTGKPAKEVLGKKLSETFPTVFTNGNFELYINCLKTGESQRSLQNYNFNGTNKWLSSNASKLDKGINVTTIDVTSEKQRNEDLKILNESLFLKNTILNNAEVVAKIGSFTHYPQMNTTEMSDNLYRLIGCKPDEFEPSFEHYKTYVHPDDIEKLVKALAKSLESNEIIDTNYRIITKNGKLRHFKSTTLMIVENSNKKMVGVIQDITQVIKKDRSLARKNKALQRSNAELESFNRVVSHDLQEPLRKIQMFISLLSETEQKNLSDKGVAFFDKIDDSAERMQLLIKNLLTYSRLDDGHEDMQEIDLNEKLKKVKDNLSERIKEAKLTITNEELPKIRGIRFQMEQLFNNLLSNAIKYRNVNEGAKVFIDVSKVHRDQIPLPYKKTSKYYHKIVFSDNGIGFNQENAEKIFEIFERLHQKTEYSGTGIGLAICKKIVENHHGFIHVTSELGKGSNFYIYLPA